MRSFFICLATLLFLASELIGLVQAVSTTALLVRSIVIFVVFLVIGEVLCMVWDRVKPSKEEVSTEGLVKPTQAEPQIPVDTIKDAIRERVASNPKQTAQVIDTLISQ